MFDLITIRFKESSARQGANHQWQRPNFLLDTGQRMLPLLSSWKIGQQVKWKGVTEKVDISSRLCLPQLSGVMTSSTRHCCAFFHVPKRSRKAARAA